MSGITYTPGRFTAMAGAKAWMLIHAEPDAALVTAIWERVTAADSLQPLVRGLLEVGNDLPDFALFASYGRNRHLVCRGAATARLFVNGDASAKSLDGKGLATWAEYRVDDDVHRVVLGSAILDEAAMQLPLTAGVFLASAITVDVPASRGAGRRRRPAPEAVVEETSAPGDNTSGGGTTIGYVAAEDVADEAVEAEPVVAASPAPMPLEAVPPMPVAPQPTAAAASDDDAGYDFLFAATQARTVEDAAIRPVRVEDLDDELPEPMPAPLPPAAAITETPAVVPAQPSQSTGSGLIDAVPWSVAAAEPVVDDDDGSTIKRSTLLKLTAQAVAADRIGPTVHALLCPVSHANPPSSSFCRLCGAPLPEQDPVTVPRPVLGVLRLSTGDVIALDRGVVMGRSPQSKLDGDDRPHVVKLPSADGEISRTHLQITLDGWHVLVTDLKSTNGTLVTLPGREPEQLRPNEPLPIQPGTVVTLADGVDFRYEVAE